MAIKRNKRFKAEIPTSALADIMFFLFLFFLIISTLANPNVIKLSVTDDKLYFLNKTQVEFDQLELELIGRTNASNDRTVVIRIPADLKVQDLVDLMQIGVKLKLNFVIATSK